MKVIFVTEIDTLRDHRLIRKRTKIKRVLVLEDHGADVGRTVAKFWHRTDAFAVAKAMGWAVTDELD